MGSVVISGATSGAITLGVAAEAGTKAITLGPGMILQVVTANFLGIQTIAAAADNTFNFVDITSLSVSITPSSSSNKILLMAQVNIGCNTADRIAALRFTGGNADDFIGAAASNRQRVASFMNSPSRAGAMATNTHLTYVDSPATTSAVTYKVQGAPNFGSGTVAINYIASDGDQTYFPRGASSLTVMEILG